MVNKTKILSELSKIAVDAMSTFSGIKKEIETIVKLRVNRVINKMELVKREEFEDLKKMVQKLIIENRKPKKNIFSTTILTSKKKKSSKKKKKKPKK